jgi:hypothetical protein
MRKKERIFFLLAHVFLDECGGKYSVVFRSYTFGKLAREGQEVGRYDETTSQ